MTRSLGAIIVAFAMLALGLFVVFQAYSIATEQSAYARVGPQVFPYVIGAGLILIAGLLARDALRGTWTVIWAEAADKRATEIRQRLLSIGLVGLGLILNAALIKPLGFVIASTIMFALTTRAFGSRRLLFDLAVAAVFSGLIFVIFTYALNLPLPAGTLWGGR